MSEPERIGAWMSHSALVRVKRGSTWISLAPRCCACTRNRNAIGWFSAMLEPMTMTQSALARSHRLIVAAPRPKEAPKLGTEEECHIRAWFSMVTMPRPPPNSFLMR